MVGLAVVLIICARGHRSAGGLVGVAIFSSKRFSFKDKMTATKFGRAKPSFPRIHTRLTIKTLDISHVQKLNVDDVIYHDNP